jgi:hypothetical protein
MMYPLVRELAGDGIPVTVTCRVLEPGLQHLADQAGQQTAVAGQLDAVLTGLADQRLGPRPQRARVGRDVGSTGRQQPAILGHVLDRHGGSCSAHTARCGTSGHGAYTKFRTLPHLSCAWT